MEWATGLVHVAVSDPVLALLMGGLVGAVLALTGAGGGVLAVPLLVLVLHWPIAQAAPAALLAVGAAAALGAAKGLLQGRVRWRAAILMGGAGMLGAPAGVWLGHLLPAPLLLLGFACLLLWLGWRQWGSRSSAVENTGASAPPCRVDRQVGRLHWTSPCARALGLTGLFSGLLSGLVGVGGGFVIVPALQRHTDLGLDQIRLTSLAVIALVSVAGVGAATLGGQLEWVDALPFVAGAMLVMPLGRRLSDALPEELSAHLFAALCWLAAGLLLWRASKNIDFFM